MKGVKVFELLTLSISLSIILLNSYYSSKHKQKQLEVEEEKEGKASPPWAKLDRNLLGEIASRLCVIDRARFGAVCTHWLAAAHAIRTKFSSSLPWHGCIYPGSSEFRIYDPLSSPSYLVSRHLIDWSESGIPSSDDDSDDVYLHGVKHNWLFLSVSKPRLFFWTRRNVFLFSPFTKRVITLPTFNHPNGLRFVSMFSTRPDSPDCVFCCVDDSISLLLLGQGISFLTSLLEFSTFLLLLIGQVASYNIRNGEFKFDLLRRDGFVFENSYRRVVHSFVLNGELLIIAFNPDVRKDATLPGQQF